MEYNTIEKLVKAAGVKAGERILIHYWGENEQKSIADDFMAAVASLGATPFLLQQSRSVNRKLFAGAGEECFDNSYFAFMEGFDGVLDLFAYRPVVLGDTLPPEKMALYRRYISSLFYALMKAKRFTQIRIPTRENALESSLEPAEYIRRMEAAYDIDYDVLRGSCEERAAALSAWDKYELYTGQGCVLRFDFSGRDWYTDAGDGDLPCGEVYIAPQEEKTNGSVYFPQLWVEDIGALPDVTLTVVDGRLVGSSDAGLNRFLDTLTPGERTVCELGFGMNPNVRGLCGYTVLDEKMHGSFHIAIGANTMFGGSNEAQKHIDFVSDGLFEMKQRSAG